MFSVGDFDLQTHKDLYQLTQSGYYPILCSNSKYRHAAKAESSGKVWL